MKGLHSAVFAAFLSLAPFVSANPAPAPAAVPAPAPAPAGPNSDGKSTTPIKRVNCAGATFDYHGLVGYGAMPAHITDKTGDTMSIGSSIEITSWKALNHGRSYKATMYGLPDRGW